MGRLLQIFRDTPTPDADATSGQAEYVISVISGKNLTGDCEASAGDNREDTLLRLKRLLRALSELERRRPDHIDDADWQRAIADGRRFTATWGEQAAGLGWTTPDLFGLAPVPEKPKANYCRLARHNLTGLVWMLHGRPVVMLTATEAAIRLPSGTLVFRRRDSGATGGVGG